MQGPQEVRGEGAAVEDDGEGDQGGDGVQLPLPIPPRVQTHLHQGVLVPGDGGVQGEVNEARQRLVARRNLHTCIAVFVLEKKPKFFVGKETQADNINILQTHVTKCTRRIIYKPTVG